MQMKWLIALFACVAVAHGQMLASQTCSASMSDGVDYNTAGANGFIGGFFNMHYKGIGNYGCGSIDTESIQILEATKFAINYITNFDNGNGFVPNVKFGLKIFDTCSNELNALNAFSKFYPQTTSFEYFCQKVLSQVNFGSVGPMTGKSAMGVASQAKLLSAPVISPRVMSTSLSDKMKYPTFLRTAPSHEQFAKALSLVLLRQDWNELLVISTEDEYGEDGFQQFLKETSRRNLCISHQISLPPHGTVVEYKTSILQKIKSSSYAAGVIFARSAHAKRILEAIQDITVLQKVQWVLTDFDMYKNADVPSLRQLKGALLVVPKSRLIPSFRDYFANLEASPSTVASNPWFRKWYEDMYSCSIAQGTCTPRPLATIQNNFVQSPWVPYAIKSVMAYAVAMKQLCASLTVNCQQLSSMDSDTLLVRLRTLDYTFPVTLAGMDQETIRFDSGGDPLVTSFDVYNYAAAGGQPFKFTKVGTVENDQFAFSIAPTFYNELRSAQLTQAPTAACPIEGCSNCRRPSESVSVHFVSGDIVLSSLVNAHLPGQNSFTCGQGLETRLVSLVAFEWAVQNYKTANPTKFKGVSLGHMDADVCPNPAVAVSFLNELLGGSNRLKDWNGVTISSSNIHAFVDDTDSSFGMGISPILSSYNLPEIQVGAQTSQMTKDNMYPYFARAVPGVDSYFLAISSLLLQMKWKHIQILTHKEGMYNELSRGFKAAAAKHGICVTRTAYLEDGFSQNVDLLMSEHQNRIVVVFTNLDILDSLHQFMINTNIVGQIQWIVHTGQYPPPSRSKTPTAGAENTIYLALELNANSDFNSYLSQLTLADKRADPFKRELFEITNQCSLIVSTRDQYPRICTTSDRILPYQGHAPYMIQSVYDVLDKLHDVITEVCQNPNYDGLCQKFLTSSDIPELLYSKLVTSTTGPGFSITNGEGTTNIVFYNVLQNTYQMVGTFNTKDQQLQVAQFNTNALLAGFQGITGCPGSCLVCQYMYNLEGVVYVPGDWLVAGSFGVHSPGSDDMRPYLCGDIKLSNGPQYTLAMMYAIDQVNKGEAPVSVNGIRLGGLALDHCGNPGRAKLMISDVYSGFLRQKGIHPGRILSWLTDTTVSTLEAEELLDPLGVPIVSPSATSANLIQFDNFYRTIQGDFSIATALLKLVKTMGYSFVQVAYADNSYGEGGKDTIASVAQQEGVCITMNHKLTSRTDTGVDALVAAVSDNDAHILILFMGTSDTEAVFRAITRNNKAKNSLAVLLPEPYISVVKTYGSQLKYPVMSLQLKTPRLTKYMDYLASNPVDNPHFAKFYMKIMQCNLEGYSMYPIKCQEPLQPITDNPQFQMSNFDLSTINAVYATVDALSRTISEFCGSDFTQPCSAFIQAPNKHQEFMDNLKFASFIDEGSNNFRFLQNEGNVVYNVLQFSQASQTGYTTIGSYAGVSLDNQVETSLAVYQDVKSDCLVPCLTCEVRGLNFSLTPGNIYVAGIFDVHMRGLTPFICSGINTLHGFLLLEAFHYALDQVNSKQGQFKDILGQITLGGVGLDACQSKVKGGNIVSNINNGLSELKRDGYDIAPFEIDTYIGSYASSASLYLARILTDLKIPQISFASASTDLNDERHYPFFYRTVPSGEKEVIAMLTFLDEMDIRYVQILFIDNSYGTSGKNAFVEMASKYRICVAQTVAYPDLGVPTIEDSNNVVAVLIEKPAADAVITFLGTEYVNSVLKAVTDTVRSRNKLRFIGSDAWGDNIDAIKGAGEAALGSVTLKLDVDDVPGFESYIDTRNLANSEENPWFAEYYEKTFNCYISKANKGDYVKQCPLTPSSIINSQGYQQDPDVNFVIDAVYAAAFAIDKTLRTLCGNDYTSVCQAYINSNVRRELINENLASVTFQDPVGAPFNFVNRQLLKGYRFYSVIRGPLGGIDYNRTGTYHTDRDTLTLTVGPQFKALWNSNCDREDACAECPAIRDSGVRMYFASGEQLEKDATTVLAFFDIHKQGSDPFRCGQLNMEGFNQFLTFMYSIRNVFRTRVDSTGSVPGQRMLVVDTCSNPLRLDQDLFGLLQGTGICNTEFDMKDQIVNAGNIGSVLTSGDLNTQAASRLLENVGITYVSPSAVSTYLDDKDNLARTVAPITAQMKFLANLMKVLNWMYLDVIYEDSAMGLYPWQKFTYFGNLAGVCQGTAFNVESSAGADEIEDMLRNLNSNLGAKAVLLFGSESFIRLVVETAGNIGVANDYVWVLLTNWDVTEDVLVSMVPNDVEVHFVSLKRLTDKVVSFTEFLNDITKDTTGLMPKTWLEEYLQTIYKCKMSNAEKMINPGLPECTTLTGQSMYSMEEDKYVLNTMAATAVITGGLNAFLTENPTRGTNQPLDNSELRLNIRNKILEHEWAVLGDPIVKLKNRENLVVKFNDERWWDPGFEVYHWIVNNGQASKAAIWSGPLDTKDPLAYNMTLASTFTSRCNRNENEGFCGCPTAVGTSGLSYIPAFMPKGFRNYYEFDDKNKMKYDWPLWAVVMAGLTGLGLAITFILFLILLCAYPKKGGASVLGYLMIFGILCVYCMNFAFFIHATDAICGIRRFLFGVAYMITIAPLLIKAIDNWRFSHVAYSERKYSGISSACSMVGSALILVLIQCMIPIMWLILVHPTAQKWPTQSWNGEMHDNWWCDPPLDYDLGLVLSFAFVVFIVLITAIFAALGYDSSTNNFESRWILFACVATGGCFLVWMIVTTNASPVYRDPTVAIANFVNATLLLLIVPVRKTVLMCSARRNQEEDDIMDVQTGYDYQDSYPNPTYELDDYHSQFEDQKPSEF